jgi:dienelactone hydrolase
MASPLLSCFHNICRRYSDILTQIYGTNVMSFVFNLLVLLGLVSPLIAQNIFLPNVTGRYLVGTTTIEVADTSTARDIMLSFFYPATRRKDYPLAPVFPPLFAQNQDQLYGLPPGTSSLLISQAHSGAPLHKDDFPLLLFSTGYGTSRLVYTAAAEDLASEGYIIVTIDHPFDSYFIEYPGGRTAAFEPPQFGSITDAIPFVERRVSDVQFVLDQLCNASVTAQIPGLGQRQLDTAHVGIFGHSLGGATAAATMLVDSRFVAGADLDGAIVGSVATKGLDDPFLLMLATNHTIESDPTLGEFWQNARGYRRKLSINGTQHGSYSDLVFYVDILADLGITLPNTNSGTIKGTRMLDIETAYLNSFFDKFLRGGDGRLLDRPSSKYPEVQLGQ